MTDYKTLLILILLSALAAFVPRVVPILYFSKRPIPNWFNEWMKYVPISLFSALVFKDVFLTSSYGLSLVGNLKIAATLFVFFVAYKTRSMGISVVLGLIIMVFLSYFFG